MNKFIAAVSYISFFENSIHMEIVEVQTLSWKKAFVEFYKKHEDLDDEFINWVLSLDDDLTIARSELTNGEVDLNVKFLTENTDND